MDGRKILVGRHLWIRGPVGNDWRYRKKMVLNPEVLPFVGV